MCVELSYLIFFRVYSHRVQASTSQTVDLVNDFFHFVTTSFEIVSTSALHIYHSALPLSPRTSILYRLYELHARPLARVVQGIPNSWEPIVATVKHYGLVREAAWSPCSRYIAVSLDNARKIEILDAVTLERLHTLKSPQQSTTWLSFSPDSRLLTQFSYYRHGLTTWDLQTGGQISTIPSTSDMDVTECFSSTYSIDGKMVAVAYLDPGTATGTTGVSTYNLLSGTHEYSHQVSKGRIVAPIWTHGECLRFVTVKPGSITVWEAGFTSMHMLVKVESFPAPRDVGDLEIALFAPTLSRLAFIHQGEVLIWDARDSKFLLQFSGYYSGAMFFSSDGHSFACKIINQGIHLWKDSPTGYVLHRKLAPGTGEFTETRVSGERIGPFLSPNGELIIASKNRITCLWRTTDPITSLSNVPTQPTEPNNFLLEFSSDGSSAAVARLGENVATVLDLKSGNPRLIINTGVMICGLRVTGNSIFVVGEGRIITWNLPPGDHVLDARAKINDGIRTITFDHPALVFGRLRPAQISPDFDYAVITRRGGDGLDIYDVAAGNLLAGTTADVGEMLWITPDGREVWDLDNWPNVGWKIVKDRKSQIVGLERLPENTHPSGGYPWTPPHGHKITKDGWIFNSRKERLVWLPHNWRVQKQGRKWDGRLLGLLHSELAEPIIIELGE